MAENQCDHGGRLDAAIAIYGGTREDWLDLSTGINPHPYPVPKLFEQDWNNLPDQEASIALCAAARTFWNIPAQADVLAVPGCSAAIAQIPSLHPSGTAKIDRCTYNEHAAAFRYHGWSTQAELSHPDARVIVHPNNPTGEFYQQPKPSSLTIIDESFCDTTPDQSHIESAASSNHIILKSFGKFWGLAGLRLGFAVGDPKLIENLRQAIGPWPVSGIALRIGTKALRDTAWAAETRARLFADAARLDGLIDPEGTRAMGACPLFRTYNVENAKEMQNRLANFHIWSRVFSYNPNWIRLGMPTLSGWDKLEAAI